MATFIPTKLKKSQVTTSDQIDFTDAVSGTFSCLLCVAGSGAPNTTSSGIQYVHDVTTTNAEVTGTGYSRQVLTGVSVANDGTVLTQVDWTWSNITFAQNASGFTNARYAVIYTTQFGSGDTTYPVIAIIDLLSNQSVVSTALIIQCPANGLIQWS